MPDHKSFLVFNSSYRNEQHVFAVEEGLHTLERLRDIMREAVIDTVVELQVAANLCTFSEADAELIKRLGCTMVEDGKGAGTWHITTPSGANFASTLAAYRALKALADASDGPARRALTLIADKDSQAVFDGICRRVREHGIFPVQRVQGDSLSVQRDDAFREEVSAQVREALAPEPPMPEPDWQVYSEHNYAVCPSCGTDKINEASIAASALGEIRTTKSCPCGFRWQDVYVLQRSVDHDGNDSGAYEEVVCTLP